MAYLGLNIYYWGTRQQNRLLVEFLAPTVRELRDETLVHRFWFDRFGARGPHIFVLLEVSRSLCRETGRRLSIGLDRYLAVNPSDVILPTEEVAARHAACRGKTQCEADSYPGLASNNSYCLFEHGVQRYPFTLSSGLSAGDAWWELLDRLTHWSIQQLSAPDKSASTRAAVRFVAAIDGELRSIRSRTDDYWRYHATTLLPVLKQRLATAEREVLTHLPSWVGGKNQEAFARVWEEALRPADRQLVQQLIRIVLAPSGRKTNRPWAPLREAVHCTLKQLGMPVSSHIPLVLFAWHRDRSLSNATPQSQSA